VTGVAILGTYFPELAASEGQLLSCLFQASPDGRKRADRRHPESLIQDVSSRSVDDLVKSWA
jgi:hypothetical protein